MHSNIFRLKLSINKECPLFLSNGDEQDEQSTDQRSTTCTQIRSMLYFEHDTRKAKLDSHALSCHRRLGKCGLRISSLLDQDHILTGDCRDERYLSCYMFCATCTIMHYVRKSTCVLSVCRRIACFSWKISTWNTLRMDTRITFLNVHVYNQSIQLRLLGNAMWSSR